MKSLVIELFIMIFWNYSLCSPANPLSSSSEAETRNKRCIEDKEKHIRALRGIDGTTANFKDVNFYLHTPKDKEYSNHTIDLWNTGMGYHIEGKIYFLIHGWNSSREETLWYNPLTESILEKYPESYVVQIDWSKLAADIYAFAAFNTKSVGRVIAKVIYKLIEREEVHLSNIVLIGHSLGAHISGWAGKNFHELTNNKVPRIIALDPAGPLFDLKPIQERLNKNDADVVMVIHTDGNKYGFESACGTIDFFPNGGKDQPGCTEVDSAKTFISDKPESWCDHQRAYFLFIEAIKSPQSFMAKKCESYEDFKVDDCDNIQVSLGDLETSAEGSFYLETGGTSPFYLDSALKT